MRFLGILRLLLDMCIGFQTRPLKTDSLCFLRFSLLLIYLNYIKSGKLFPHFEIKTHLKIKIIDLDGKGI